MQSERSYYHYLIRAIFIFHLLLIFMPGAINASGAEGKSTAATAQPAVATVANATPETALATVTLLPKAVERLGITTTPVISGKIANVLQLSGEVMIVPGRSATVLAPAAGTVLAPENGAMPQPGMAIKRGQEICRLLPIPPERDLIAAREKVAATQARVDLAAARVERAKKLYDDQIASHILLEDAQAELAAARIAFNAAQEHLQFFAGAPALAPANQVLILPLIAPMDGILQNTLAAPGQIVPAATPIITLVDLGEVWIRIPVYVGDLQDLDLQRDAGILPLGESPARAAVRSARLVDWPKLANPNAMAVELCYALDNHDGGLRPGQKVGVTLALNKVKESLLVPYSAILYDLNGGTWVYVKQSVYTYSRRRVEVRYVIADQAALARGPAVGAEVVTVGAAELFGTEFGGTK